MSREDSEQRLKELLPEIASALGWKVETSREYGHYGELIGPLKGARLGFFVGYPSGDRGKAEISGKFPEGYHLPYGQHYPKISISLSKSGAQIAKDIERRLFPEYETMLDAANTRDSEHKSFEKRVEALADRIAAVVDGKVEKSTRGSGYLSVNLYHSRKLSGEHGDVKVSDGSVTIERFDMTPDEAEAVLKLIIKMRSR